MSHPSKHGEFRLAIRPTAALLRKIRGETHELGASLAQVVRAAIDMASWPEVPRMITRHDSTYLCLITAPQSEVVEKGASERGVPRSSWATAVLTEFVSRGYARDVAPRRNLPRTVSMRDLGEAAEAAASSPLVESRAQRLYYYDLRKGVQATHRLSGPFWAEPDSYVCETRVLGRPSHSPAVFNTHPRTSAGLLRVIEGVSFDRRPGAAARVREAIKAHGAHILNEGGYDGIVVSID